MPSTACASWSWLLCHGPCEPPFLTVPLPNRLQGVVAILCGFIGNVKERGMLALMPTMHLVVQVRWGPPGPSVP